MILGTSKIWSKSGPVDLLIITNMLQKIQENMGNSWKHIIFVNMGLKKYLRFENVCPRYHVFSRFWVSHFLSISCYILYFTKMRIGKWYIFNKKHIQKLGYEFHIYEEHEMAMWSLFYFQVRESPNFFIFKQGNHPIWNSR